MISSCESNDNDPCEGLILDVISQTLFIEVVNVDGVNLLENGTYDKNTISAEFDGTILTPLVFDGNEVPDLPEELRNVLGIPIFGENNQKTIWNIHLDENDQDILEINVEIESEGCSGTFYNILEIAYNGVIEEVTDIGNNGYKIVVTKE